jgi:hypothetical protein
MKWCNQYNCFCSEVEEITEGMGCCDYECYGCEEAVEI